MKGEEETHQKRFRGNWVRPEVFHLVETKQLTPSEAFLLLIVDNFVEYGGEDCYASNEFLAEKLGVGTRMVQLNLAKLRKLGLLVITGFDGRKRFLCTTWSNLQERSVLHGRGEVNFVPGPKDTSRLEVVRNGTYPKKGPRKTQDSGGGIYKVNKEDDERRLKVVQIKKDEYQSFATDLLHMVSSVRKVNARSKPQTWFLAFRLLHTEDGIPLDRIRSVLEWYRKELETSGDLISNGNPNFIPIAYTGQKFREKFDSLEGSMFRRNPKKIQKEKQVKVSHVIEGEMDPDSTLQDW